MSRQRPIGAEDDAFWRTRALDSAMNQRIACESPMKGRGTVLAGTIGMMLFPNMMVPPPYQSNARHELRRIARELQFEAVHAQALGRCAAADDTLAFKAIVADVRMAALRARSAQLRRAAGRLASAREN